MLKGNYAGIVIYLTQHSNLAPCSQLKATRSAILVLQAAVVAKLHFQNYKVMLTLIRTEHSPKHNMKRNIVVNTLRWNGEVRCISIKLWKKASCDWQITSGPTYSLETDCLRNQDHGVVRSEHKGIFGERPAIWGGGGLFFDLLASAVGWVGDDLLVDPSSFFPVTTCSVSCMQHIKIKEKYNTRYYFTHIS